LTNGGFSVIIKIKTQRLKTTKKENKMIELQRITEGLKIEASGTMSLSAWFMCDHAETMLDELYRWLSISDNIFLVSVMLCRDGTGETLKVSIKYDMTM
jgi:hypothetical protein